MKIGAQLYTIHDYTKDLKSLSESLKKIADIGYKTVQVSGTCPYEAKWLDEQLKANGLECVITHIPEAKIIGETQKAIEEHKIFGCDTIGLGYYDFKNKSFEEFNEKFSNASKIISDAGLNFSYHNHDHEFRKDNSGKTIMTRLLEEMPELCITLDTYWVQSGGGDPIWWINAFKGRIPCIHYKDMAYGKLMAVVGEGNMNFEGIIKASIDTGVKYALVEQDNCNGEDPFDCLKRSYEYLKAQGLE